MTKLGFLARYCTRYMFCKGYHRCLVDRRHPIYKKLFYASIAMEDPGLIKKITDENRRLF